VRGWRGMGCEREVVVSVVVVVVVYVD